MGKILRCVLTGGPCGGKTSGLNHLKENFQKKGYVVVTVPESATLLCLNGGEYPGLAEENRQHLLTFEDILTGFQIDLEDTFVRLAKYYSEDRGRDVVIFYDRGLLDIKPYVPEEMWHELLSRYKVTEAQLLERYDIILHLVTAADGAEEFYTNANNAARIEGAELARELDGKTYKAWENHVHLHRIPNKHVPNAFSVKLSDTIAAVEEYIAKSAP